MDEEKIILERKRKIISFVKKKYDWITYILLAIIVYLSVRIRTRNLPGLKDITTGDWTLGPDLDPFLFLRWAKYILEHGSLMAIDTMRYVPIGFETNQELLLHPYMVAWFHKLVGPVFGSVSVTYSAVIYPVFFFALTVIAFFLFTRKVFVDSLGEIKASAIALIASFFLSVIPLLIPRTIAGIPEKESAALFFMFMAFYLFISSWKSKHKYFAYIFVILSSLFTAGMALIWGGFGYIFLTLSATILLMFLLGQMNKSKFFLTLVWLFTSFAFMIPFSSRYTLSNLFSSVTTGSMIIILLMVGANLIGLDRKIKNKIKKLEKIPLPIISLVLGLFAGLVLGIIIAGPRFISENLSNIYFNLVKPAQSRLIQTVSENRQPYFVEWTNNFGPIIKGFPIFFWLFFVSSGYLFWNMIKPLLKKDRIILICSYFVLLFSLIFSRYSRNHLLNGENLASVGFYFSGVLLFLFFGGLIYNKYYSQNKESLFKLIKPEFVLLFSLFILGLISARGAVRLILILVPSTSILVSYLIVDYTSKTLTSHKSQENKIISGLISALLVLAIIFSGVYFYQSSNSVSEAYTPSVYTNQWQKAMFWVRENTGADSVFAHWWDYGYWIQSLGERATVLDGGNAQSYWNHLMGRHALTGTNNQKALEFLYAHNVTHFLIDSTDIGKYGAFSNIGSDINYDRASNLPIFLKNKKSTQESKTSISLFYEGGFLIDSDIIYENNGDQVFLPGGNAGTLGVVVEKDFEGNLKSQPIGIFVYNNQQYNIPLKYYYEKEFIEFEEGIDNGIFIFPSLTTEGGTQTFEQDGALIYLSNKTIKSQLARLYLYEESENNFELVHLETDFIIEQIRLQNQGFENEFIYFNGLRGPIKIWELNYPIDIPYRKEYIDTEYPEELQFT